MGGCAGWVSAAGVSFQVGSLPPGGQLNLENTRKKKFFFQENVKQIIFSNASKFQLGAEAAEKKLSKKLPVLRGQADPCFYVVAAGFQREKYTEAALETRPNG